jgi:hypothetical protein
MPCGRLVRLSWRRALRHGRRPLCCRRRFLCHGAAAIVIAPPQLSWPGLARLPTTCHRHGIRARFTRTGSDPANRQELSWDAVAARRSCRHLGSLQAVGGRAKPGYDNFQLAMTIGKRNWGREASLLLLSNPHAAFHDEQIICDQCLAAQRQGILQSPQTPAGRSLGRKERVIPRPDSV